MFVIFTQSRPVVMIQVQGNQIQIRFGTAARPRVLPAQAAARRRLYRLSQQPGAN